MALTKQIILLCFFSFLATILFFSPSCFSEDIVLEKIVVRGNLSEETTQSTDYILQGDVPLFSMEEIVDYSSSVDLKKRSPFGIQQDVSLRGSIFEDTSINLQGIEINDPQTGHYNLELPLTSADIQGVGIYKNSQIINFTLKKPKSEGGFLKTSFGQHALWEELLSLNFPLKEVNNRLSIEHKISKGARQDTDFEIYNLSLHSLWEGEDKEIESFFGSTEKDFGAGSFYSSFYPHQEEHTTQRFFSLRAGLKEELFKWNNSVYLRRHTDKFILNRHNPSFYTNYHTTYVYGLKSEFDFANALFFALDAEREKITSTNLDKHRRLRKGFSLGVKQKRIEDFVFDLEGGFDYYENWEYLENAHIGLGYFLKDNLKLRFSFDKLWRAPSFTELYYTSPANLGNSKLKVQKSNNFELGLDQSFRDLSLSFTSFLRRQSDTIDWGKNSSADPWQAENIGSLKTYGFDFSGEAKFKDFLFDKIGLGYTYLNLDKESPYNFSAYVFDYNRHKIVTNFQRKLKDTLLNLIVNFSNPVARRGYTTVDLKAEKKIDDFTLILEGINIFNQNYQEVEGIESSGRWFKLSMVYSF